MRRNISKALGMAAMAIALATSAQAQGRGHDKDRGKHHDDRDDRDDRRDRSVIVHRADGDVLLVPRNHAGVPPGLAKKPGGLPPGQFKKRYTTLQGANTLSSILRRRGYVVERVVPSNSSRLVYFRDDNGILHRAVVSPGTNQLGFSNVPASLLQQVMSALYGY